METVYLEQSLHGCCLLVSTEHVDWRIDVHEQLCTFIRPPQVRARVSCPARLKVDAVMDVITAAYRPLMLAMSFL